MDHFSYSSFDYISQEVWESPSLLASGEGSPTNSPASVKSSRRWDISDVKNEHDDIMLSDTNYNNVLSDNAIESIRRLRNQNKLIHLDPIPDFKDKNEIKPWLQKIFYPQGIEIVIERSDRIKVIFKCKASKRSKIQGNKRADRIQSDDDSSTILKKNSTPSTSRKKKRAVSRFNTCPFRVRATFSLKRKKWSIVVINNGHSHPLEFNPNSDDYNKFKNHLRENKDWDTLKKFDELEYRTKFNLPTEMIPISCECGLTQEFEFFDVVLPSNKLITTTSVAPNSISLETCISGTNHFTSQNPKSKACNLIYKSKTSPQVNIDLSDSTMRTKAYEGDQTNNSLIGLNDINSVQNDVNEIDFTELFLKPLLHSKNQGSSVVRPKGTIVSHQLQNSQPYTEFIPQPWNTLDIDQSQHLSQVDIGIHDLIDFNNGTPQTSNSNCFTDNGHNYNNHYPVIVKSTSVDLALSQEQEINFIEVQVSDASNKKMIHASENLISNPNINNHYQDNDQDKCQLNIEPIIQENFIGGILNNESSHMKVINRKLQVLKNENKLERISSDYIPPNNENMKETPLPFWEEACDPFIE